MRRGIAISARLASLESRRRKFAIKLQAADRAHLKLGARLSSVAKVIVAD